MLRRAQVIDLFRKLPTCLVSIKACGSAYHWARGILACGHDSRVIPPINVKAYGEVTPPMPRRFARRSASHDELCADQDGRAADTGMGLKARDLLARQRTQHANAFRPHLSELGIVTSAGMASLDKLTDLVRDPHAPMPDLTRRTFWSKPSRSTGSARASSTWTPTSARS